MAYRDELEAALAHATAAEEELATARAELSIDEKRIADLERQLAQAQRKVSQAKDSDAGPTASAKRGGILLGLFAIAAIGVGAWFSASFRVKPKASLSDGIATFDVSASLPEAVAMARTKLPDAELVSLKARYVSEDGQSQLQYSDGARYRFRSSSRAAQPLPRAPVLGAPVVDTRQPCLISVWVDNNRPLHPSSPTDAGACGDAPPVAPLHCTLAAVWRKALTAGAPRGALADISLDSKNNVWHWRLTVTDRATSRVVYRYDTDDDCLP